MGFFRKVAEKTALIYGATLVLNIGASELVRYVGNNTLEDLQRKHTHEIVTNFADMVLKPTDDYDISIFNPAYSIVKYNMYLENLERFNQYQRTHPILIEKMPIGCKICPA